MELYLQFGYGMKELSKDLLKKWGSGTVILSPRDIKPDQVQKWAWEFREVEGKHLLDPQLYYPKADHHRLISHDYWPETFVTDLFTGGRALKDVLNKLKELNNASGTVDYILPGIYDSTINEDWFKVHESIVNASVDIMGDMERLATICVPSDCLRLNEEQLEAIVSRTEDWDVDGYYIVAEHPNSQYLVDDPLWLSNLLVLCSGLKLQKRRVIVGYCSHQMLCLAAANVDAIASGTWLNIRVFGQHKFYEDEDDSTSRRVTWYYCPQSLSEYKIPFLDIAYNRRILGQMAPDLAMDNDYPMVLFSGALPSSTSYKEGDAFRHYLHSLHFQCRSSGRPTFRETVDAHEILLSTAEQYIKMLHSNGVRGQDRDFASITDVNRAALTILEDTRGFVLERQWGE
jgi:hypothetical protein